METVLDVPLVPLVSTQPGEDYLCVNCWSTYSLHVAKELPSTQAPPAKKLYVATDGYACTDGRVFAAYLRSTGTKLKHIKVPLQ